MTSEAIGQMERFIVNPSLQFGSGSSPQSCHGFNMEDFQDPIKVKRYTGLPDYNILMNTFKFLEPHISHSLQNKLSKFNEFIVVLMRLRLYCPLFDLSYRFDISTATVCRIFEKWILVMRDALDFLVAWPSRDQLHKTMPMCFRKNYGCQVAAILDCFEVFIERPSSLNIRAMTWSNYKHHNTVKFLVCVAPQGVISYSAVHISETPL